MNKVEKSGAFSIAKDAQLRARYTLPLPADEFMVADVIMYRGEGCYTYTRPLFDHEIKASTIHQSNVEKAHRPAADLVALFYQRLKEPWKGGALDSRAALAAGQGRLVPLADAVASTIPSGGNGKWCDEATGVPRAPQLEWWCPNVAVELAEARAMGLLVGDEKYYRSARALMEKGAHVGQHWRVSCILYGILSHCPVLFVIVPHSSFNHMFFSADLGRR